MAHLPQHHYPEVRPTNRKYRDVFIDYSTFGYAEYNEETSLWQGQSTRQAVQLCAMTPTLPLIPPNEVPYPFVNICMGDVRARRSQLRCDLQNAHLLQTTRKQKESKKLLLDPDSVDIVGELETLGLNDFVLKYWTNRRKAGAPLSSRPHVIVTKVAKSKEFLQAKYFPRVNSAYSGGCLGYISSSGGTDSGMVIYPSGSDLSRLTIRNMTILEDNCKAGSVLYDKDRAATIRGIQNTQCQGREFLAVRDIQQCVLYEVVRDDDRVKLLELVGGSSDGYITSIIPSPYLPGEAVVATSERKISLISPSKSINVIDHHEPRFTCHDPWCQAYFGTTPRSVIVTDRTSVQLFDIRGRTSDSVDIFSLPYSKLYTKERIMASTHCEKTSYHLVATDYTLMLLDERFPKEPVMLWHPCLRRPPQYLQFLPNISQDHIDDLVLIGCQDSLDVLCYPLTLGSTGESLPHDGGPPWRLSHIDDFPQISGIRGSGADMIAVDHRLSKSSLIGVHAVPFNNSQGFTALQLSACGDLFYQVYRPGHPDDDRTCSAGPGGIGVHLSDEMKTSCKEWLSQLQDLIDRSFDERIEKIPYREIDVTDMFTAINKNAYPHNGCYMCMADNTDQRTTCDMSNKEDFCMTCGCQLKNTKFIQEYAEKGDSFLTSERKFNSRLYERVAGIDIDEYTDPYSQLLLKQWNEDDEIRELILERDKLTEQLKKKHVEEKKKKLAKKRESEFKVPDTPSKSNQSISPRSVASHVSRIPDLASFGSNYSVCSNRGSRRSSPARSPPTKSSQTFQSMSFALENNMKGLLDYDKSQSQKQEHIPGFDSIPRSPKGSMLRARSSESLFSMASTPSHFIGTAKEIDDCIKCISDYESDAENVDDAFKTKNRHIRNWMSVVETSGNSMKVSQEAASSDESQFQKQLGSIGLSVQTTSHSASGRKYASPRKSRLKAAHLQIDSELRSKNSEYVKVGDSFDNLSLGSASHLSQSQTDLPSPVSRSQLISDQNVSNRDELLDAEILSFSQGSNLNILSQTVFRTPKSPAKRKKKPHVSGF